MLQIGIWIAIKQVSSLSDQVFLRSLTKAVAIQQEHIIFTIILCRFLLEITPNMLKGIANLTPVFWNLAGTVNQFLNMTYLYHFLLEILANILINIAGMAQHEVFVLSPELLAKGTLVVIFHISPYFLLVPRKYGNKVVSKTLSKMYYLFYFIIF